MLLKRTYTLRNKIESKEKENKKIDIKSAKKDEKVREKKTPPKKLSNYIKTEENFKFISKNKAALKEYEIFLNRFKKKKTQMTFGSINKNVQYQNKMSIFKDNPKLIISSFKTNFTENKAVKHNNNILGVDEGLIVLPRINFEEEQYNFDSNDKIINTNENIMKNVCINTLDNNQNISNIFSNNDIKINNGNNDIPNNSSINNRRIYSYDNKKKIIESYLDRGEEIINRFSKKKNRNERNINYIYKNNKTMDSSQHFKYEIRRLNKWDFNNLSKEKGYLTNRKSSTKKISNLISEIKQSQKMNWLTEIKNNREQFKLICRNKHLKDFINKINEDQNAIFMQNIKVLKKDFNFKIFIDDDIDNENNFNEEKNYSGNKSDTYNQIIREKIKLEENLSQEVSLSAEQVYNYKKKILNERASRYKLSNVLNELKKKEEKINLEYNDNIKRLDLYLQQLENTINQKNENKNGSESKSKSKNSSITNNESSTKIIRSPRSNTRLMNTNMGNLKSKKLSIINSQELNKIRTVIHNNIGNDRNIKRSFTNNKNLLSYQNNLILSKIDEIIEPKEEELVIKQKLLSQKTYLDKENKKNLYIINTERNQIKDKISEIDERISKISEELRIAKNNFNEHIQSLSDYYYQILKKGFDVRRNGLSWVIIKLMELNAFIDASHFPNFLDAHQINYLMRIGAKIYEVKELIKLFQLFKKKEKIIKEGYIDQNRNKEKEEKKEKLDEIKKNNKNKIGNNYIEFLEGIQQKYDNAVNFNLDDDLEEKNINKTSKYLKEIILHENEFKTYYIPGSLAEYFSKDKKFREYFDDVYYLNEEINKRQREIQRERDKELKYYRNKFRKNGKNVNENIHEINTFIKPEKEKNQTENENDLFDHANEENRRNIRKMIFCALFGNGTPM